MTKNKKPGRKPLLYTFRRLRDGESNAGAAWHRKHIEQIGELHKGILEEMIVAVWSFSVIDKRRGFSSHVGKVHGERIAQGIIDSKKKGIPAGQRIPTSDMQRAEEIAASEARKLVGLFNDASTMLELRAEFISRGDSPSVAEFPF